MNTTWMTKQEAADHLRVTPKTIDRLVRDGKLTKHTVAGSARAVRFRRDELDALVQPEVEPEKCEHLEWAHQWEGGKPYVRGDDVWRCESCGERIEDIDPVPELELICCHVIDLTEPIDEVKNKLYTHFDAELNGNCGYSDLADDEGNELPCPHGSALCSHV